MIFFDPGLSDSRSRIMTARVFKQRMLNTNAIEKAQTAVCKRLVFMNIQDQILFIEQFGRVNVIDNI